MKFYSKNPKKLYRPDEEFIITKFAWKPIRVKGETRWLEKITVRGYYWIGAFSGRTHWVWQEFID